MIPAKGSSNVSLESCDVPVDIKSHLRCSRCTTIPLGEPLYTCFLGHITCNSCRAAKLSAAATRQEMESEYEFSWRIRGVCLCGQCGGVTKLSNYVISKNTLTLEDKGANESMSCSPSNTHAATQIDNSEYVQQNPMTDQQVLNNALVKSLWTSALTIDSNDKDTNIMTNAHQMTPKQSPVCSQMILTPQQYSEYTAIKRVQVPTFNSSYVTIGDQVTNGMCLVGMPHANVKSTQELMKKDSLNISETHRHSSEDMVQQCFVAESSQGKFMTVPDKNIKTSIRNDDHNIRIPVLDKVAYFNSNSMDFSENNHLNNSANKQPQDGSKVNPCNSSDKHTSKQPQNGDHASYTGNWSNIPHSQYTVCSGANLIRSSMEQQRSEVQLCSASESRSTTTIPSYMATLFKEEQRISQLILEKKQKTCEQLEEQSEYITSRNDSFMSVNKPPCEQNWSVNECEDNDFETRNTSKDLHCCKTNLPRNELRYKQLSSMVSTSNHSPTRVHSRMNGSQIHDSSSRTEKSGDKSGKYNKGSGESKLPSLILSDKDLAARQSRLPSDIMMMMNPTSGLASQKSQQPVTNIQTTVSYCDHKRKSSRQVIVLNSSHRPILCPNSTCGQSVSPFGLASHMAFMHQSVPLLDVEPGVPMHVWIKADQIPYNEATCILLVLLAGRMRGPSGRNQTGQPRLLRYRDRLALPLMVARLAVSVEMGCIPESDDAILVWMADVDSGAVVYTAGVTDRLSRSKSFTFRLPAYSLRNSQLPADVYQQGDCIVVSSAMLNEFCKSNGGFDIFLLVHSMDTTQPQVQSVDRNQNKPPERT